MEYKPLQRIEVDLSQGRDEDGDWHPYVVVEHLVEEKMVTVNDPGVGPQHRMDVQEGECRALPA